MQAGVCVRGYICVLACANALANCVKSASQKTSTFSKSSLLVVVGVFF